MENATRKFAEVQTAYEVLSDGQERAWYDSHQDQVLRGDEDDLEGPHESNVKYTSASQITALMGKFNRNVPFTDDPAGFYGSLQEAFATIAREETAASEWSNVVLIDYPGFGSSSDNFNDVVKPFYKVWQNFSTKKSFSWKDLYAPSKAPDRATRRLIDKENRKSRDEAIKEFNDAVRHLVAFVRKRDPRYSPNSQTEADRQMTMRDAAAAQAARSRAANKAKMVSQPLPAWVGTSKSEDEMDVTESEESEVEHIECVACHKTFKSEKQFEAHERSKKHLKAIQQVRKQMQKDEEIFDLAGAGTSSVGHGLDQPASDIRSEPDAEVEVDKSTVQRSSQPSADEPLLEVPKPEPELHSDNSGSSDDSSTRADDDYVSRSDIESRLAAETLETLDLEDSGEDSGPKAGRVGDSKQKVGKAKAKRAKKAEKTGRHEAASGVAQGVSVKEDISMIVTKILQYKCARCHNVFPSKTKLFNHISIMNHAQPIPVLKRKDKR